MYTNYFSLTEMPFSIAPNPQYLFMSKRHQEALAHLLYGVQTEGGGFILLTGEVGTGKTTLCRCLIEQIPTDVETAFVLNPRVSATELLATIADEFGFRCPDNDSLKTLTDALNKYLLQQHRAGKKSVLIIDEAQNLSRDVLEQLRLLTNLETNERKLLQIILLGQPELAETLSQQSLRQFSQRITARYHLDALDPAETLYYIEHRLALAGSRSRIFNGKVVRKIHKLTKGVPRLINLVCDRSLLGAYSEGKKHVSLAIAHKAAKEVMGSKVRHRFSLSLTVAGCLFFATFAAYWFSTNERAETLTSNRSDSSLFIKGIALTQAPVKPTLQELNHPVPSPVLSGHGNINAAWHDLFILWGAAFVDRKTDPCELALEIGLMCMKRNVQWRELTHINRPAIVMLANQYMTLSEINGQLLTLFAGSKQFEIARSDFLDRFDGDIHILWRTPPAYKGPLKRHDRGAAVDWLVNQMAVIDGRSPPLDTGYQFDALLEERIQIFQENLGLIPSGVVDPITWIHINSVEAVNIPLLDQKRRG